MKTKYHYRIVHSWLAKHYGKADHCENPECNGKGIVFEYALKIGHEHDRNRDNYLMLCRSCHRNYDMTDEKKAKISSYIAGKYNDKLYLGPIAKQKPVILMPDNLRFDSGKLLADYLKADKSSVYMVLSGKRKSLYGKTVMYADN